MIISSTVSGYDRDMYLDKGKLKYYIWDGSGHNYEITNSVTGKDLDDNKWHLIVHTCISGAPCETYIDGKRGNDSPIHCSKFDWADRIIFGRSYIKNKKFKGKMRNIQFLINIPEPVFVFTPSTPAVISNVATDAVLDKIFIPNS